MNSQPMKPADAQPRQDALDITQSFAVSAPAGSGKTSLLTQRVLTLLAAVDKPEEVLCITFTRKAAQEMRERILGTLNTVSALSLEQITQNQNPYQAKLYTLAYQALQQDKKQKWQLQKLPYRLKIMTIDGYCASLAKQLPFLSQLGTNIGVLEDPHIAYRGAVESMLDDLALARKEPAAWHRAFRHVLSHLDNNLDRLVDLFIQLQGSRDQWLPLVLQSKYQPESARHHLERSLQRWLADILSDLQPTLAHCMDDLLQLGFYAAKNLQQSLSSAQASKPNASGSLICRLQNLPLDIADQCFDIDECSAKAMLLEDLWRPLTTLLLTNSGTFRKSLDKRIGFPAGDNTEEKALAKQQKQRLLSIIEDVKHSEDCQALLAKLAHFPTLHYRENQWQILQSLIELLPVLVAHLKLVFQAQKQTDFIEITQSALHTFDDFDDHHSDVAQKLDYTLKHILIDEFQDTSAPQLRLLEGLTKEWLPGDGKSLFIVGDGMQSCYSFRNANVGIFLGVRHRGVANIELRNLDLSVNFRSTKPIVDWVNQVFQQAFPARDNISHGAVRYALSSAYKQSSENRDCASYIHCKGFIGDDSANEEAREIAGHILRLRTEHPNESIAILARTRAHLAGIVTQLKQFNISYEAVDIDPLQSKTLIRDLLSLTRALHNFGDRIAWLAVLRAPWCGLDLHDMYALCHYAPATYDNHAATGAGLSTTIWQQICRHQQMTNLSDAGKKSLARVQTQLQLACEQFRRKPLNIVVESLWLALGGHNSAATAADINDTQTFFELLARFDNAGRIVLWPEFTNAIEKLYASTNSEQAQAVQLMTMHKSKGLEFDTVFLPALNKPSKSDDPELLYWYERIGNDNHPDFLLSPIASQQYEQSKQADKLSTFLKDEMKIKRQLEQTRLFYVACTRAKKRLYLSAQFQADDEGEPKPPSSNTLLAKIWPEVSGQFTFATSQTSAIDDVASHHKTTIARLPLSWQLPPLPNKPLAPPNSPTQGFDNSQLNTRELFTNRLRQRSSGTLFHRILRRLTLDGLAKWNQERIANSRPYWQAQLGQLGLPDQQAQTEITKISHCLTGLLQDPTATWVLDHSHQDSQCELPVWLADTGQELVLDRTFIDQNTRWIIDYKTSQPATDTPLAQFIDAETVNYRAQLDRYKQALSAQIGPNEEVRCALFFPYLCHLEKLD